MKRIVILGAGTAGTITANKLAQELDLSEWKITIVDQSELHYYQPGFLFIPFGIYSRNDVVRSRRDYLPRDVELIISEIELIEADKNQVKIKRDGRVL
ncbi:MAG: tryptophan 7-halogenase, partial [Caldilineae bacterium]|nr:tryptophan 7-halogenase [Caldilineae bacterium]